MVTAPKPVVLTVAFTTITLEMKLTIYIIIALAVVSMWSYLWLTGPTRLINKNDKINEHLNFLKDELKANPNNNKALTGLLDAMNSSYPFEQNAAIFYLGEAGDAAKSAVPEIIKALNEAHGFNSRAAAISLGQIGPSARSAIPDLIKAVKEQSSADVGWFSAESLGLIATTNDLEVMTILYTAVKSSIPQMQSSAEKGLSNILHR